MHNPNSSSRMQPHQSGPPVPGSSGSTTADPATQPAIGSENEPKRMGESRVLNVAILCASKKSVYKTIPGCDVYDIDRDARTFPGGMPVVAHPPCRLWSAFCAHQAKSENPSEERLLGRWCVNQVALNGGVVEQPAHSRLWEAMSLPKPGWATDVHKSGFSMELLQFWFGDSREKNTWLWFSKILPSDLPETPFRLKPEGGDRRIWQLMSSKNQRERTPIAFAEWLVACARLAAPVL